MLNVAGPIQSNLPPIQEKADQFLKVNQRFAGEIIKVSNDQVVLAVNGIQIVAKMTSMEQMASLMEKRYAYFIIKDITENQITLQLANNPNQTNTSQKTILPNTIGQAILEQLSLTVDENNLAIVQTALNNGLKVTTELMNEVRQVLESLPQWNSRDVQLAISIKSAGLPLTTESLTLAQNAVTEIKNNFLNVFEQLETEMNRPGLTSQMYQTLRSVQIALKDTTIQGDNSTDLIEKNLNASIKSLGSSIENEIARIIRPAENDLQTARMSGALFALANLRHELGATNSGRLNNAIDNFIQGMRWMHFVNAEPDHPLEKGQWTQLDLPISFGFQNANHLQRENVHDLQIRVAHENDENSINAINPNYTRLIIQVGLDEKETIKVDLSIVSNLIGAEVTGSSEDICLSATEELDKFQTGLANLGYTLRTSKVELGGSKIEIGLNESDRTTHSISSVDLGV